MSAEAMGYVFRHSPHTGAAFQVHLAIADSVNDQHGNELWMSTSSIAKKARVARQTASEALATIEAAGGLVVVEDHRHDYAGKPSRYRFLFPTVAVFYESRGVTTDDTRRKKVSPQTTGGVTTDDTNPREPKDLHDAAPPPEDDADGMPLTRAEGMTYAETLARWLGGDGLPAREQRDESYAAIVRHVDAHLAKQHPKRTGVFIGILADYVADVADVDLANGARGHLGRLIKTHGPVEALRGLTQAVVWGAGLDEGRPPDVRDLTKYATAVINGKGSS